MLVASREILSGRILFGYRGPEFVGDWHRILRRIVAREDQRAHFEDWDVLAIDQPELLSFRHFYSTFQFNPLGDATKLHGLLRMPPREWSHDRKEHITRIALQLLGRLDLRRGPE